jgi:hypothetical protein
MAASMMMCFGFWRHAVSQVETNVSEKHPVTIFRAKDEDIMFLRSAGIDPRNYMAPKPKTT